MEYLNNEQKRFLQSLGRVDEGRALCEILDSAKNYYSSIATIDTGKPADPQIEGRKLLVQILDELKGAILLQKRTARPLAPEDFTS